MNVLPRVLTKNWKLKLSALAMAILLWTVPRFEAQDTHVFRNVPVVADLSVPGWAQVGDPRPATVDVTVSGTARELLAVSLEAPPIVVPVDSVGDGEVSVTLRASWFTLPGGGAVVVEGLNPGEVRMSFEPLESGVAVLAATMTGTLPEGMSFTAPPTVEPPTVRIDGPASLISALDTVYLTPVDLSEAAASHGFPELVDTTGLGPVRVSPMEALVQVQVGLTGRREFPGLPVERPALEPGIPLRVLPDTVILTLVGAESLLEAVDPADLRVTVPQAQARALAPGQEVQVFLEVMGIPELLQRDIELRPPWVTLRRPAGL